MMPTSKDSNFGNLYVEVPASRDSDFEDLVSEHIEDFDDVKT